MKTALKVALALTVVAVPALAISQPGGHGDRFMAKISGLDSNGDGAISLQEIQEKKAKTFKLADSDGDGYLSVQEMMNLKKIRKAQRMLSRHDGDGDGKMSLDEYTGRTPHWLTKADTNQDGQITLQELKAMKANKKGRKGKGCSHGKSAKMDQERAQTPSYQQPYNRGYAPRYNSWSYDRGAHAGQGYYGYGPAGQGAYGSGGGAAGPAGNYHYGYAPGGGWGGYTPNVR
ncbi:MAG: hypothetical protein HQL50_06875 [Magnetococcales bacterium]|nr:hypothetical protein [Magnetococcales bacterium]